MSIQATQLISEVKIIGVTEAQTALLSMGAASDAADVSLSTVADASTVLGGYLGTLGEQVFSAGAGFDGLSMSAADATGVLAESTDIAAVSMEGFVGAVDLGALSTEEYVAYMTEASLALGLWEEFTAEGIAAQNALSASMGGVVVSADATTASLVGTNTALADTAVTGATASGALKGVAASEEATEAASSGLTLGLGLVIAATAGIGAASLKMAEDYQQSMLKVQALTGASDDQMKQFDSGLKQLSMDTGVAPKKLSDGLYNVISAGYQGKDAMTVLALATKDATIGMTDAKVTTDALTNVMAQFSVGAAGASRVNGEMLETVTLGKSSFQDYASSIVKSASSASQFHESMETMNAAFATMTSSGINAKQASTDFQASLKVMDGNIGTVTKSLNKSGIAFDEAKFNAMDYGHKVVYLNTALEEANTKHIKVTGATVTASQAIKDISDHISTYNSDLTTLSDKQAMADKTQQAWSVTSQGFIVSLERLKSTAQVVMIDLGQHLLPIATGAVNLLNNAFQAIGPIFTYVGNIFKSLDLSDFSTAWIDVKEAVRETGQTFQMLAEKLKPVSADVDPIADAIGTLAHGALQDLTAILWKAYEGISAFNVAFHGGKGPITDLANEIKQFGPPIQNIANLLQGQFMQGLKFVGDEAKQVGDWFKSSLAPALQAAMPGFLNLAHAIVSDVIPAIIKIHGFINELIEERLKVFISVMEKVIPPVIRFAGILAGQLAEGIKIVTPYVVDAVKAVSDFANEIDTRVAPIVDQWIKALTPLVKTFMQGWNADWPIISGMLKASWESMAGIVKIAWALISGIIKIGLDIMSGNWKQAWTDFKDMLGGIWDGIKTYLKGAMDALITLIRPLVEALSHVPGPAGDMARGVLNAFDGMKDGAAQKTADMKVKVLDNTAQTHIEAAKHFDVMRQELIDKMNNTKDPVVKHALEMKINTLGHMEDMHMQAASKAEDMKKGVVNHVKDMKEQSQGGIAGVGKYFGDKFTDAKNAVTGAFGSVGKWFEDRWTDIKNVWGGVGKWFQDRWSDISKAWETGVNKVTGFFNYLYEHSRLFQKIVDNIRDAFNTAVKWIQDTWKGITDWLTGKWDDMNKSSKESWKKFSDGVHDAWNDAIKHVTDAWNTISGTISGAWNTYIAKPLGTLWTNVSTFFGNVWTNYIAKPVGDMWKSLSTSFSNAWTDHVSKPLGDLWTSITTNVSTWGDKAYKWGVNLITSLASGITAAVSNVLQGAVTGVANKIKDLIGWHSPTKEGPGADSNLWAPNLVKMMSTGLEEGVPKIETAVARLAKPIALTLNPVSNTSLAAGIRALPSEATALPAGASVIPSSASQSSTSGGSSGGQAQPIYLQIDSHTFARIILPAVVNQVRNQVGVWDM